MSSADFRKILVEDARMRVTDSLPFGVVKSGQNVTTQIYPATSQSASSMTFSIQTPSEVTLLDRNIVWKSTYEIEISGVPAAGEYLVDLGNRDALAPLPLHMSATTLQVQVNNNSVSVNIRDVLPQLLRMYGDDRSLARWNGIAPLAPDTYRNYSDQLGANNNSNGSFAQTADNSLVSRGTYSIDSLTQTVPPIAGNEKNKQTIGNGTARTVRLVFTSFEPLFLSPFHFANLSANQMAIYGVSNLNFIFNISAAATRLWRCGATPAAIANYNVSIVSVAGSQLIFQMLTPHPSQILPSKNVVDYVDFPRYLTTFNEQIPAAAVSALNELVPATKVFSSNNIQLNQVPDMLVICARKPMSSQTNRDADCFFPISNISINWNNQSGLLANAERSTLFRMSAKTTNQTFQEFRGFANRYVPPAGAGGEYNTRLQTVLTSGSILALRYGQDIPIVEEFYAAGSLGSFNLQFNVTLENYTDAAQSVELVLMCVNSGLFITSQGVSSTYTGILTKSDVLSASEMKPVSERHLRLVGGVESSALNGCADIAPKAQEAVLDAVSAAKSALGKGVSGGADGIGGRMKLASRC